MIGSDCREHSVSSLSEVGFDKILLRKLQEISTDWSREFRHWA